MRRLCTLILAIGGATTTPLAAQLEIDDPWARPTVSQTAPPELQVAPPGQSSDDEHAARITGAVALATLGSFAGAYVGAAAALESQSAASAYSTFFFTTAVGSTTGAWMANRDFGTSFAASLLGAALGVGAVALFGGIDGSGILLFPIVQGVTTGILGTRR